MHNVTLGDGAQAGSPDRSYGKYYGSQLGRARKVFLSTDPRSHLDLSSLSGRLRGRFPLRILLFLMHYLDSNLLSKQSVSVESPLDKATDLEGQRSSSSVKVRHREG